MPAYDADRAVPPAPYALVTIRHADTKKILTDVPMLLDTGSDASLIPRFVVEALSLVIKEASGIRLVAFDGTTSQAMMARAEMLLLNKTFRCEFLLTEDTHGIIGRDILNLLSLRFDGPNLFWDELRT